MYHCQSSSSTSLGGGRNHISVSHSAGGGTAMRITSSPLVCRSSLRSGDSDWLSRAAPSSGARQQPSGRVAGHMCLCPRAPMAPTQGWHLLSSTPTRIAASLACGHCPPATAEIKYGLRASCQASTSLQQWLRGLSSLPMASAMSTSVCGAPLLESVGALPAAVISWPGGSNKVWGLRHKRRESLSNLEAPPPH